jgi:hypothetical protein
MDSHFLSNDIKSELKQSLSVISDIFQQLKLVDAANPGSIKAFDSLQALIGNTAPSIQSEIEQFKFEEPAQSFQEFLVELGPRKIQYGLHLIDRAGVTYRNTNTESYDIKDPIAEGQAARAVYSASHPQAPEADLIRQYDLAYYQAELHNKNTSQKSPTWKILKRDSTNECRGEDALLQFTDIAHKNVDYYAVVHALKKFGESLGYTEQHFKACLTRFISFFNPSLRPVVSELNANELARFLLRLSAPVPKQEILITNINNLVRNPGESIRIVLAQLLGLLSAYYNSYGESEKKAQINRVMIMGLISFTSGTTQKSLMSAVESAQMSGRTLDHTVLTESVLLSEKAHGTPMLPLQFKSASTVHNSLFHSTFMPTDSPVRPIIQPVEYSLDRSVAQDQHPPVFHHPNMGTEWHVPLPLKQPVSKMYKPKSVNRPNPPPNFQSFQQSPPQMPPAILSTPPPPGTYTPPYHHTPDEIFQQQNNPSLYPNQMLRQMSNQDEYSASENETTPPRHDLRSEPEPAMESDGVTPRRSARLQERYQQQQQEEEEGSFLNYTNFARPPSRSNNTYRPNSPSRQYSNQQYPPSNNYNRPPSNSRYNSQPSGYSSQQYYMPQSQSNYQNRPPSNSNRSGQPQGNQSGGYSSNTSGNYQNRPPSRSSNTGNRPPSRSNSKSNQQRSNSKQNSGNQHRDRSRSPHSNRPQTDSSNRQSRQDYTSNSQQNRSSNRSQSNSRYRSNSNSRDYIPGENCPPNYKPNGYKFCSKCLSRNHHEHLCQKYYRFSHIECSKCHKGFHIPTECYKSNSRPNSNSSNNRSRSKSQSRSNNSRSNSKSTSKN